MNIPFELKDTFERHIKSLEENPRNVYAMLQLSWIYGELKMPEKKKELLDLAVKTVEENPNLEQELNESNFFPADAYYSMALYWQGQKDFTTAIEWYQKIIDKYPQDIPELNIYHHIGDCYCELGKYEEALKYFQKQHDHEPTHWTHHYLGFVYNQLNQFSPAIQHYFSAIELIPKDEDNRKQLANYYTALANVYMNSSEHEKAYEAVQKALSLNKDAANAIRTFGNYFSFSPKKDIDLALQLYEQSIEKEPGRFDTLHNIGMIYQFEKCNLKKAEQYYLQAMEIQPHYRTVRNLALLYQALNEEEKFQAMVDKILELFPEEIVKDELLLKYKKKRD